MAAKAGLTVVGELFHDHEIVRNVTYESLWDNLGMSDINAIEQCSIENQKGATAIDFV